MELSKCEDEPTVADVPTLNYPSSQNALAMSMIITDDKNIKHQFIDVGSLTVGAVFGIGEGTSMRNRVIIARFVARQSFLSIIN